MKLVFDEFVDPMQRQEARKALVVTENPIRAGVGLSIRYTPVGPQLQAQGIPDNLVLSTRRASTVVNYLVAQGTNPNVVSAKGFGETHPVASNDTPQGRAANRRIVITVQGPGATTAEP